MRRVISAISIALLIIFCFVVSSQNQIQAIEVAETDISASSEPAAFSLESYKNNHPKVRGIYVTGPTAGTEKMDDIINLINETELNAIVLDVKDDAGNISFKMDNEMVINTGACIPYIPDIQALMKKLKDNNIYVIARIPCFKDPTLAAACPELSLRTLSGEYITDANGNAWVNPCKEEVWNYIISIADSCAELGFDEIQLDYVRFPVGMNAEQAYYGAPTDDESRQQYINTFIESVTSALHQKNIPVTADVFGTIIRSEIDSHHIGQSYTKLAESLDCVCPMIYPSHYASGEFGLETPDANPHETIYLALKGSKDVLFQIQNDNCAVIRPWLQAFTASWVEGYIEYDGAAIRQEIDAVYEAGYDEWILWNSKSNYTSEGLVLQ